MILHPEELDLARAYTDNGTFEGLTAAQLQQIRDRARTLHRWFKTHPLTHSAISIAVLIFLFTADYWILLQLPRVFLGDGPTPATSAIVVAGLVAGSLHSYLLVLAGLLHDARRLLAQGAVPDEHAPRTGGALRRAAICAGSRRPSRSIFAKYHLPHHLKFGTEEDGEFLNFVVPRRYWLSLLPLAAITNFNDFVIHRPPAYTRSRLVSVAMALTYNGVYAYLMYRAFGGLLAFIVMALLPHVGFYLDRLRQFTEHNLMPLENENGARSLGSGILGHAARRRPVGLAVPSRASSRGGTALVRAAAPAPPPAHAAHAAPAPAVPGAAGHRMAEAAAGRSCAARTHFAARRPSARRPDPRTEKESR